ncbi:TPT-domain-containing protein [Aspergillus homomorphus CBS 101889]|uniref:TPT-domain-containing protein n=1 Tax=Aspergillus homomorphus (strain CBS 101889) TaxID=1450537 RepID=A0A395I9E3_ASPHC|nr:TPT-domain-containing protein [Aspergillus homomorphus CBS 101889]RAL15843.1 TPT-domain-containing protein [Aspergillus homomorphus CBS 101889]
MIRSGSGCQWFTRRRLQLSLAFAVVLACIYTIVPGSSRQGTTIDANNDTPHHHKIPFTSPSYARSLSARELISRRRSSDLVSIPKLIHQTWFPAGSNMSENAQFWVQTMRAQNPDWEYVLWDDETNQLLVETHFPWFLQDYLRLPKEILRADVVRNLYMFLFGGMYADVDTEALRPVDGLFSGHDTPLRAPSSLLGSWTGRTKTQSASSTITQRAFLGHMAHAAGLDGPAAVPNGWMASPPGHPFWLLPVIHVIENPEGNGDGSVESLTGPTAAWVFWSNLTILFNKWLIESTEFRYPIILTTWHLVFATLATQLLARTTPLLNSRHSQHMNASTYARQIVPIGLLYSGSLVTSNMTYLYLPVSFIQMLKAGGPIVTLLTSWAWGVARPSLESFVNILVIAVSVGLAVAGEVQFVWTGVLFQLASLVFDANRLVMIQVLLSEDRHQQGPSPHPQKMDPLVTLYYSAPVCAATNFLIAACSELPAFEWEVVWRTGVGTLVANAAVGFMLNVSIFVLIGKTSGLTMTLVSVPKNILLIVCSIVIWGSPVTSLQVLGYGIALLGLLYYSLGWRTIQPLLQAAVARVRGHRTEEVKYEPV